MSILKALKEKVEFLKSFDGEIAAKKGTKELKAIALKDVKQLLKEVKAKKEAEADIQILEELKKEFLKPNVLGDLAQELLSETQYAVDEVKALREAAEAAKEQYKNTLKELDVKHSKLMNDIRQKRVEYENVALELGFEYAEVRSKLHIHETSSPALIVSREPIYL